MAPTDDAQLATQLGDHTSTVHAVLVRCRINRLGPIDRATREPLHRHEHPWPLLHADDTKSANIPDSGWHRL